MRGGEVIELVSDLGGGKTTFVRGLARGAGSPDKVSSPSFTINKIYQAPKFTIEHFDFYRLAEAGVVGSELAELIGDPKSVIVVEWANVVQQVLPKEHLQINIKTTGEQSRELQFKCPDSLKYLLEGVC